MCLQSQEDQDLCVSVTVEEHIFNTSSEHQTVDLSKKYRTKDFLRDFRYGCTVHGGQVAFKRVLSSKIWFKFISLTLVLPVVHNKK